MARIIIDSGRTTRRRKKYTGIFGTIFEIFSVCLAATRLFKRAGKLCKKTTGTASKKGKKTKSSI